MSQLRAAAQQALEALEYSGMDVGKFNRINAACAALRAALAEPVLNPAPGYCKHCKQYTIEEPLPAEPVQEPVAWLIQYENDEREVRFVAGTRGIRQTPLYAAPPQRKPLSEEEISKILDDVLEGGSLEDVARAIERAHGITE